MKIALVPALLLCFLIASLAGAAEKPDAKAAWEKAVAAAKKEGEVRVWGDMEITHPDIVAAFSKEFPGIKPVIVSGKVGDLMPRIIAERRAGKYLADVYSGGLGRLKPVLMLPDVVDESKWLNGKHNYADAEGQYVFMYEGSVAGVGLYYNSKLVDSKEFHSYWDALGSKWKGKILLFERPGTGSPNMVRFYYN